MAEQASIQVGHIDSSLQGYVDIVDQNDSTLPITVFVEGIVVSGTMISENSYFRKIGDVLTYGMSEEEKAALQEEANAQPEDEGDVPPQIFLHLEDAKIFTPGGVLPNNQGFLWRGKLSAVSGFSVSRLSAE